VLQKCCTPVSFLTHLSKPVFLSNFQKTALGLRRKPAAFLSIAAPILFLNSTVFGRSRFGIGLARTV
jgi:hypothetical protein